MSETAHRLGAIELIELGRPNGGAPVLRRPYLSSPRALLRQASTGIPFAQIDAFLVDTFGFLFDTMSDLLDTAPAEDSVPRLGPETSSLRQVPGGMIIFDRLSEMLINVPSVDLLVCELQLLTKMTLMWKRSVPGISADDMARLFTEVRAALHATRTEEQREEEKQAAREQLLDRAEQRGGEELRNAIDQMMRGEVPDNVTGAPAPIPVESLPEGAAGIGHPPEDSTLESALKIGVPAIFISTLVFLSVS